MLLDPKAAALSAESGVIALGLFTMSVLYVPVSSVWRKGWMLLTSQVIRLGKSHLAPTYLGGAACRQHGDSPMR